MLPTVPVIPVDEGSAATSGGILPMHAHALLTFFSFAPRFRSHFQNTFPPRGSLFGLRFPTAANTSHSLCSCCGLLTFNPFGVFEIAQGQFFRRLNLNRIIVEVSKP